MRLGGCLLVELAIGTTLIAGAGTGAYLGGREITRMAAGARAFAAQVDAHDRAGRGLGLLPLETPPRLGTLAAQFGVFQGVRDEYLLAPLATGEIQRVKFNRGGSSISLRITFASGAKAAFKPNQTNDQTIPRYEVAAYRLNRMLGLSSVAPAIPRRFTMAELLAALDPDARDVLPRINAEVVTDGEGNVDGMLAWWIPEIADAKIEGFTIDSTDGILTWRKYLTAGEPMPAEARLELAQISTMTVFDFLIENEDRWSGSNTKASPDGRMLFFMDNTMSFGAMPQGTYKQQLYLSRVQKFSRGLYRALRALDGRQVRDVMTSNTGPYDAILTDLEIDATLSRRDYVLAYIDALIAQYGEEAVLVFP